MYIEPVASAWPFAYHCDNTSWLCVTCEVSLRCQDHTCILNLLQVHSPLPIIATILAGCVSKTNPTRVQLLVCAWLRHIHSSSGVLALSASHLASTQVSALGLFSSFCAPPSMANAFIDEAMRSYGGKGWRFETHALPHCEVKALSDIEAPLTGRCLVLLSSTCRCKDHRHDLGCAAGHERLWVFSWCCFGIEGAKGCKLARTPAFRWNPTSRLESWGRRHGQRQRAAGCDQVCHLQGQGGNAGSHKIHCWLCVCSLLSPRSMGCQEGFPILVGQVTWTPCPLEHSDQMAGAVQEWIELCVHLCSWYREPPPRRVFCQWQRARNWCQQWAVHMGSDEHQGRFG